MKPRVRYAAEFNTQAVELLASGKPVPELAEELCDSYNLLYNGQARRSRRLGAQDREPERAVRKRPWLVLCPAVRNSTGMVKRPLDWSGPHIDRERLRSVVGDLHLP